MFKINEVELADKLATDATIDELVINGSYESEEDLYEHDDENNIDTFKDGVQDVFNRWYDYYYDMILECK